MSRTRLHRNSLFAIKMGKTMRHLVIAVFCLGLSACQNGVFSPAEPILPAKTKYPITVQPHIETLKLSPAPVGKGIGDADALRIGAFAANFMRHGHGRLSIESAAAPVSKSAIGQIKAINGILAEYGVPPSQVEWRTAAPVVTAAADAAKNDETSLVLSYTRYAASSPPCGDWSKDVASTHDNQPMAGYGCATQNNLAVMLADPADLKRPRKMDPADAARRGAVLEKYREGQASSTPRGDDEKGTVSEVAR